MPRAVWLAVIMLGYIILHYVMDKTAFIFSVLPVWNLDPVWIPGPPLGRGAPAHFPDASGRATSRTVSCSICQNVSCFHLRFIIFHK